jgi:hypothetical protein
MTSSQIAEALAAPFEAKEVHWLPMVLTKDESRALAVAYVDARDVMNRLDRVVGIAEWQDEYQQLSDGTMLCRLSIRLDGEWITKCDVGGQSKQPDAGDKAKSAVSEALKRAAVKFGIARYLYRLEQTWVAYDPKKKVFLQTPTLPPWALPKSRKAQLWAIMKRAEVNYGDCMEYLELGPQTPFTDLTPGQLEQIEEYCRTRKPVATATEE